MHRTPMFSIIPRICSAVLGRAALWRLGRALYLRARLDLNDCMDANGELALLKRVLQRDRQTSEPIVLFDVGANIGDWTWNALQVASQVGLHQPLQIYAFEPVPSTFESLKHRVQQHSLHMRVSLVLQALSSKTGCAELFVEAKNSGVNSLHSDTMRPEASSIQVNTSTLDAYCSDNGVNHIHLLKCDTEGHDMEVLSGAAGLFAADRIGVCQFEYNHRWVYSRHFLKDVFDFASNIAYRVGKVTPQGIEMFDHWHPELERFFQGNYVLVHESAVEWLNVRAGTFDGRNTFVSVPTVGPS